MMAATGALLVGSGLSACGEDAGAASMPDDRIEILELAVENDQFGAPDLAPAGASVGDVSAYTGWLTKDGRRVGQGGGSCQNVRVDGAEITKQCVITVRLEQGSLTMQALGQLDESPLDMAITGGTSDYRGAQGIVRYWDIAKPTERLRAEITHPTRD
ncbi:hypothetical protein DFR70_11313 [Nocardia tenerifensis]|uniref:Allene oxide cyclase barrel-like domain-containing protein n=1 Tax=Nocardia tenerifensis TaxID=228006 RepID=A0A318KFN2_9NOCA|nr:hypothetical protein [Nocardia tenerifensis]PXX58678.1 hypothetical protein DFR70_11313 [Nocardia tenerifensis]